jgi:hypothetical protein|nr:MAG TPA: holin [Caudoviricetes sp.]
MDKFFTYEMLLSYATCVTAVFGTTQFIKEIPFINKLNTKYLSFFVAVIIVVLTNIATNQFKVANILLYILSSIFISMNANGIYDFDSKKKKQEESKIDIENKEK